MLGLLVGQLVKIRSAFALSSLDLNSLKTAFAEHVELFVGLVVAQIEQAGQAELAVEHVELVAEQAGQAVGLVELVGLVGQVVEHVELVAEQSGLAELVAEQAGLAGLAVVPFGKTEQVVGPVAEQPGLVVAQTVELVVVVWGQNQEDSWKKWAMGLSRKTLK